jgi:hypothetical protein
MGYKYCTWNRGTRSWNQKFEDSPRMHTFLNFIYCKGTASLFSHLLLKCLFCKNVLQMTPCKWGLCSSHHNSFSFSSVYIFKLHQTFVFLLRVSALAFFFLNNVQNWCADLLIKKYSLANRAALPKPQHLIFPKAFCLSLSANWNL